MSAVKMPLLPDSDYGLCFFDEGGVHKMIVAGYTEENMHAYAQAYASQQVAELEAALKLAMSWIDNWSPEFTGDPKWISDSEPQIRKALNPNSKEQQ